MTKKSAVFVLALVGLIGLTIGCKESSSGIEKSSTSQSSSTLDSRDAKSARVLVGHWRNTTVMFENTKDAHLGLSRHTGKKVQDRLEALSPQRLQLLPHQAVSLKLLSSTGLDYFWTKR